MRLRRQSVLLASTALVGLSLFLANRSQAATILVHDAPGLVQAINSANSGDRIILGNDINLGTALLPPVNSNITIDGGGHTISAGGSNRIFFLNSSATIENVTLSGGAAHGGNGAGGNQPGGGGLGAGGAIFVNSGNATISGVQFSSNSATGGNGGAFVYTSVGTRGGSGGGGLGGSGGAGGQDAGGGGGGYSGGGGGAGGSNNGSAFLPPGTGGAGPGGAGGDGSDGTSNAGAGGAGTNGGNGGAGTNIPGYAMGGGGGGGGVNGGTGGNGSNSNVNGGGGGGGGGLAGGSGGNGGAQVGGGGTNGGAGTTGGGGGGAGASSAGAGDGGDFGGGGGGVNFGSAGSGGFGGGGGGSGAGGSNGGNGGFGGGGGSSSGGAAGGGGVGGGSGNGRDAGGGAALGGAVFVRDGASLTITDGSFTGNGIAAGNDSNGNVSGAAAGSDLFLTSGTTTIFAPTDTLTFNGTIADDSASSLLSGQTYTAGTGLGAAIAITGGTVVFNGANSYSGGTTISAATLVVGNNGALGAGSATLDGGTLQAGGNYAVANAAFLNTTGGIIDSNGHAFTYSGVIADGNGSGALTVISSTTGGKLILSGANTYSGGTILTSGALNVGIDTVGAPGAITSSAIGTGTLRFNGGTLQAGENYTIANEAVVNTAGGTIDSNGHAFTYSGVIADGNGPGSLTVISSTPGGMLTLTGANSYSGGTTISSGILSLSGSGTLGTGAVIDDATLRAANTLTASNAINFNAGQNDTISAAAGATFNLTGDMAFNIGTSDTVYVGSLTDTGTVNVTSSNVTVGANAGALEIVGGILKDDSATLPNGQGSFATALGNLKSVTIDSGATLEIDSHGNGNTVGTETYIKLFGAGDLVMGGSTPRVVLGDSTFSGQISGSGYIGIGSQTDGSPSTTVVLTGDNNSALEFQIGPTSTLQIGDGGTAGSLSAGSHIVGYSGGPGDSGALLKFDHSDDVTLANSLVGTFILQQAGEGILTVAGNNAVSPPGAFDGSVLVSSGGLSIANDSNLNGASIALDNGTTLYLTGSDTFTSAVTVAGDPTFNVASGMTATWSGLIADGASAGDVEVAGSGTLVLANASNSYSGGTVVEGGATLEVLSNGALGRGGVTLEDGAILALGAGGTYAHALNIAGTADLSISSGISGGAIWSGKITDGASAGTLQMDGGGALALTNNGNTYSGGTIVIGGSTLVLDKDGEIGSGTLTLADAGSYGTLKLGASFDLSNTLLIGESTGFVDTNGYNMTIAHAVTGTNGQLEKIGAGTLTLTGQGTDLGGLDAAGGTLAIKSGATVTVANLIVGNGSDPASLILDGAGTSLTSTNAVTFLNNSASALDVTVSGGATYTSQADVALWGLSGPGYVAPVVTITGAGSIWHADGGVEIGQDLGPIHLSGIVNVVAGGTLDSGSISQIDIGTQGILNIGTGGLAGTVLSRQISDDGKIVADFTDSSTLSAVLYGEGSLTKNGSGTLILTSDISNYTGGTTINGGTLQLGDGTLTGYISGAVTDNANLAFDAGDGSPLTFDGAVSGSGSVTILGGEITLQGANSYQGGTVINGGTLYVDNVTALGDSNGSLAVNGGTLDLNGYYTVVGTLTGTGGTITTTGGDAVLDALVASGTTTLATNLQNGVGTLALNLDATATGGTVILTGNNSLTGVAITGGTLQAGATGLGGGLVILVDGTLRTTASTSILGLGMEGVVSDHVAAAAGTTLTITDATLYGDTVDPDAIVFGSATDTGTIVFGGFSTGSLGSTIEVAGGTVRDSGDGNLLAAFENIASFKVDAGATFDVNDAAYGFSPGGNLLGAGTVKLGSNAATKLFLSGADFSGTISGAGGVEVLSGTAAFAGTNSYTGGTTIDAGATFLLTKEASFVGNVADSGIFQTNEDVPLTLGGVISGSGVFNQTGNSVTTLSGINTFTGVTNVTQGTLKVTGSLAGSHVAISSGATLSGSGKVGTTTIASGGTMAATGMTVQGNLTLAAGSAYKVALVAPGIGGNTVTGTATVTGSNLTADLSQTGLYNVQQPIYLLTAAGGVTGNFSSLQLTGAAANVYRASFGSDANDVFVTLRYNTLSPLLTNATPNEAFVAGAVDSVLTGGSSLSNGLLALFNLNEPALNAALDQISGQIGANTATGAGGDFAPFLQLLMNWDGGADGGTQTAANFAPGQAYGSAAAPQRAQLGNSPLRAWGTVFGGHTGLSTDAATGAASLSASNFGMAGGLEGNLNDSLMAGISLAGGAQNFASGNGTGKSNDLLMGLYARQSVGAAGYVAASFAYGWHDISTTRIVMVGGTNVLGAKLTADEYGGRVETGWRVALDDATGLVPYIAVTARDFEAPAYSEKVVSGTSGVALSYAAQVTPSASTELGTHLARSYALDNGSLTLSGTAAWAHQLDGVPVSQINIQGLSGSSFLSYGVRPARDTALLGLHADVHRQSGLTFGAGVDGQTGTGTTIVEGSGTFSYRW